MSKRPKQESAETVQMRSRPFALADLPPLGTRRWVPRRKAEVVAAMERGVLTADEACERYGAVRNRPKSHSRIPPSAFS